MATAAAVADESLYQLLNVRHNATELEIIKAWHSRAVVIHPDKLAGSQDEFAVDEAARLFKRVALAFDVLSHPELREAYDRTGVPPEEHECTIATEARAQALAAADGGEASFAESAELHDSGLVAGIERLRSLQIRLSQQHVIRVRSMQQIRDALMGSEGSGKESPRHGLLAFYREGEEYSIKEVRRVIRGNRW